MNKTIILILVIIVITVITECVDYPISFTGKCNGGYSLKGTAILEVHGNRHHIYCSTYNMKLTINKCRKKFVKARITLHGRSATLFNELNEETQCWLENYSDDEKTMRIIDYGCPNELIYV